MSSPVRPLPIISLCCGLVGFAAIASAGVPSRQSATATGLSGATGAATYEVALPFVGHRDYLARTTSVDAIIQAEQSPPHTGDAELAATGDTAAHALATATNDQEVVADAIVELTDPQQEILNALGQQPVTEPAETIQLAGLGVTQPALQRDSSDTLVNDALLDTVVPELAEDEAEPLPLLNAQPLGLLDRAVAFFHLPGRKPTTPPASTTPDTANETLVGTPLPNITDNAAQTVAALASNLADGEPGDRLIERSLKVGNGDTLMKLLVGEAVPRQAAHDAINALRAHYNPRRLRVGQELALLFSDNQAESGQAMTPTFVGLRLDPAFDQRVEVSRQDGGGFTAELFERPLQTIDKWAMAKIEGSVMAAGREAGVPPAVLTELIRAFSYNVDFQRDLQPGDRFILQYDQKVTADGHMVEAGDLRYAALNVGGERLEVFRYEFEDGRIDFYDRHGESVRTSLLRTPVEGARISSGYGMRRHPILGYSKMHRGVDFAAPTGTPIYAAGDGVVEKVGRFGSYGNYIRIRHPGSMKTAYAHLRRFAKGMTPGTRVSQGQVIGYVGSTGRSTGPHLHYEVIVNGSQTNPMTVSLPTGEPLKGTDLDRFHAMADALREEARTVASRRGFGIQLAQITN